jgi:hypothetical protein
MTGLAQAVRQRCGADRYVVYPSVTQAYDYHHHGALAQACDVVVTVCQSIAHLTAAMGLNVRVLTPKRVAWRYGLSGESWYWYPHQRARLIRQERFDSWEAPIARVVEELRCLRNS